MPMSNIETIYREFIKKNNTNKKKFRKMQEEIEWDYITTDEEVTIKCRVDHDNEVNIMFQNSFSPDDEDDYDEFEGVIFNCLDEFYYVLKFWEQCFLR